MLSPRSSFFRSRWTLVFSSGAVAFCGYFGWAHFYSNDLGRAGPDKANGLEKQAAIPVTIAQAKKADFPVYLNGLGVVEPYQTFLCAAELMARSSRSTSSRARWSRKVMFVEIDPRPYQAALDQAVAKKAQDEASLKNAQLDLHPLRQPSPRRYSVSRQKVRHATGDGR